MKKNTKSIDRLFLILFVTLINVIQINYPMQAFGHVATIINNQSATDTFTTDDIIELQIATDNNSSNDLDLTPLTRDFTIVSKGKQISHSIINGNTSSKLQWLIGLRAKKSGKLIIPAITIGAEQSKALNLKVIDPSTDPNLAQEIFINIEADNQSLYLQTPIKITMKVYVAADITVRDLELNNPESADYVLFKLNEQNKQVFYKNKRYNLFQVAFLGFYNKPGKIALPRFTLTGLKLKSSNNRSSDIFSLYQQQWLPFERNNPELKVQILEKPSSFNNIPWLAAENITIEQSWTKDSTNNTIKNINAGDAIQRTITIKGTNIPAEYLPALYDPKAANKPNDANYKIYVDKPELNNKLEDGKLYSTLSQKITYITTKPGDLDLVGHKVAWWNNKTKAIEHAILENKVFNITGTNQSNTKKDELYLPDNQANSSNTANNNTTNLNDPSNKITTKPPLNANLLYMLIALIFILVLIIFYLMIRLKNRNNNQTTTLNNNTNNRVNTAINPKLNKKDLQNQITKQLKIIKNNATKNDAQQTYQTLCELANIIYTSAKTISGNIDRFAKLKQELPLDCQENINNLTSALYGNNATKWDPAFFIKRVIPEILQVYGDLTKNSKNHKESLALPDLYPE